MARANPYTDEDETENVEHLGGTPGGGLSPGSAPGSTALGMSSAGNAATAQPGTGKHDRQDQFVSWDRLFNSNAGNADRTATAIEDKVGKDVKTSTDAFGVLASNGEKATSGHYTPITYAQAPNTPDPSNPSPEVQGAANSVGGLMNQMFPGSYVPPPRAPDKPGERSFTGGEYNGATDISTVDGYGAARDSVAPVANDMDVYKNRRTGNIMSLLGQNTPGGNSRLDNALVNRSGGDRFDATYGQYGNYADTAMDNATKAFTGQVEAGQGEATGARDTATAEVKKTNEGETAAYDTALAERDAELARQAERHEEKGKKARASQPYGKGDFWEDIKHWANP